MSVKGYNIAVSKEMRTGKRERDANQFFLLPKREE